MTFQIFERGSVLAIARGRSTPRRAAHHDTSTDLAILFRLDDLPAERPLLCRWSMEPDGLACHWEPDIVVIPQR